MPTIKLYLDTRRLKAGNVAPLKALISHYRTSALLPLSIDVPPEHWDAQAEKLKRGFTGWKLLNMRIAQKRSEIEQCLFRLECTGKLAGLKAQGIKQAIIYELHPELAKKSEPDNSFASRYLRFANSKKEGSKLVYMQTFRHLRAYAGKDFAGLRFEDINKEWLTNFDNYLAKTSPSKNSRNIHMRNIRAVFNDAIDDEVTNFYPFRKFKIRPVPTRKRALNVEQLRALFTFQFEPHKQKYVDMFKLIFLLCGINGVDLCNLKEIRDGRIEYRRAKTGRLYSIKVEPEATEIIAKYRGKGYLLYILDRCSNYKYYMRDLNRALRELCHTEKAPWNENKEVAIPPLSTYWARHSWATIAASLDIPKETIAAGLGHGGNTVTDIYIDFDQRKVDEANRRIIDWVLYGKK